VAVTAALVAPTKKDSGQDGKRLVDKDSRQCHQPSFKAIHMATEFYYDVAFSFAGEDRKYVQQVADILHKIGAKVFYDDYERTDLWGKDLFVHLDDVYRKKSRYCVIFVSKSYKEKLWPNHERESAQARAFQSGGEYILPARFDDTEIPGMRPTQGYIDLRSTTPEQLADILLEKLGLWNEIKAMIEYLKHFLGGYEITVNGDDLHFKSEGEDFETDYSVRLMLEMYRAGEMERMFIMPAIVPW
jgi:hypothetical protein